MNMKIRRILCENDIKRIVADYFRTRADSVSVSVKKQSEGYGQGEHIVDCVEITVDEERECPIKNLVSAPETGKNIIYTPNTADLPLRYTTIHSGQGV